ncbi:hypothetical protein [Mangrovibacterium sp.]|uniref:hypothetical protein n=1 Tax=Mangrovibacterium sp. TaxID=1961364 RepID=UPI00356A4D19
MNTYKLIFASLLLFATMVSCEKYEDYVNDFDYTSAYFSTQKPLRTIVARDEMQFEVGVALGGMRTDDGSYSVDFEVDPTLLDVIPEASGFIALPEEYYTLGNVSNFDIIKDHMRTVYVTLNRDAFTSDPLSLANTYAIPLRITNATVDSIPGSGLETATILSKDITILVVKYISQYSGYYYSKGVQYTLDINGNPTDTTLFYNENLSQNAVKQLTTEAVNVVSADKFGNDISGNMELTINSDNSVELASSDVVINSYDCTYLEDETTFYLDVNLTKSGTTYQVKDTLILRQAPELDLRFEEW